MAKHIFQLIALISMLNVSIANARTVKGKITVKQVPNTSQVTVQVRVHAQTQSNDTHMRVTGGYTLECPVNPMEKFDHKRTTEATANVGNVLTEIYLPLGHGTDHESYFSGYPMTRTFDQVKAKNKAITCKIKLKSNAAFAKDQINMSWSGLGFQYNVSFAGAISQAEETISALVTLNPPEPTGSGDPCAVYCAEFDPLLIDLNQDGIHLGPAGQGVWFDMLMLGAPQHMQWVAQNGDEAFLAYDLNGNGIVDNGSELFGNGTFIRALSKLKQGKALEKALKQAQEFAPNGFVALAQFDKLELGGNDDGVITSEDAIWSELSLWLDSNADGLSTLDEMLQLSDAGITQLDIIPKQSQQQDAAGNWIPLWAWSYNNQSTANRKHKMVDVFFKAP